MENDRQQDIKERAYAIWEAEGRPHGRAEAHWQQAQEDLAAGDGIGADDGAQPPTRATEPKPTKRAGRKSGSEIA